MKRAVVCVATTQQYQRGMARLSEALKIHGNCAQTMWSNLGIGWPSHAEKPYAFKAYAMKEAADRGGDNEVDKLHRSFDLVLWCDACIRPIRSLEPLWEQIEREGYWICRNGWTNYEWTADSAYPDLFSGDGPQSFGHSGDLEVNFKRVAAMQMIRSWPQLRTMENLREINKTIPHVVATSFGLNLKSDIGKAFLDEYFRLASETRAFCGPWINSATHNFIGCPDPPRCEHCGPADVLGHRHDQTAASVIAWRLGMKLTDPPNIFAYPPGDERTILLADGAY